MPRFRDDWVVTKSLFDYTTGGSCACCSFPATLFNPDGIKGLINSISDLETDDAEQEIKVANQNSQSPWPIEMRDSIWSDRVKVRYKMKKEMDIYKNFWEEGIYIDEGNGIDIDVTTACTTGSSDNERREKTLLDWCKSQLGCETLKRMFQMPRSEITETLSARYGICPAYGTVMCTVVEQVANFELTKYDADSRGKEEIEFEKILGFNRRGGFMLKIANDDDQIDDHVLLKFIQVIKSLGGPKLLERGPSTSSKISEDDENDDGEGDDDYQPMEGSGPSFRSDRRIVRLVIARYWADQIISKYQTYYKKDQS